MTTNQNPQPTESSASDPQTFLPLHTAVVLLTAIVIGLVMGWLTALTGVPTAAAVIAGLTSADVSIPVLRYLIR